MKTNTYKKIVAYALCLGFFSWTACKENKIIPAGMIPPVDNIHTFELDNGFFAPVFHPGILDSAATDDYVNYMAGLGKISGDPFFGTMTSAIYMQFAPPTLFYTFPDGLSLDSAVVTLPYYGFSYGDTGNAATNYLYLRVYEISEAFARTDNHYSFQQLMHEPEILGQGAYSLEDITQTYATSVDTTQQQLRIPISKDFAQQIVDVDDISLTTAGAFAQFMSGLYIVPKDTAALQNRISYFKLSGGSNHPKARLNFYMHDANGVASVIYFPYDATYSAFFSHIEKDYSGVPAQAFVTADTTDSLLIQGAPGFYTEITLNNLNEIPAAVINSAKLLITAVPIGNDDIYTPPLRLYVEKVRPHGGTRPIADITGNDSTASQGGLDFINGTPEPVMINGSQYLQYTINFPRELQHSIMKGDSTLTLRVSATNLYPGAFRMVANGTTGNPTEFKVNVVYTKIQ